MTTVASKANMDRYADQPRVVAYSPTTGEEFSANPSDYWNAPPEFVLKDHDGDPMILVVAAVRMVDVEEALP